ncbi:transglutaminaseTgpA domain-containing protein [Nonomuraea typhae]|uniref:TransglutaminaseTgpA domain-containing protein n=1 Tax=Nonomuraea typhae TaxID=2603600 RepID=A0ABW7YNP6_9ACTN
MRLSVAAAVATFCAAILLHPLFEGGAWFWGSFGAVLTVLAASAISGRLSLPAWAAGLLSLAGLGIFLTAAFAGDKAWALVVPTRGSVAELAGLLGTGWADIQRFAAPVPGDNPGIALLTTGGVGIIAVAVDLLAARLRRAALAGLPMLALATVPATILVEPIAWWAFIIAALGFTGLLVADGRERVGHWGRAVLVRRTRAATMPAPHESADTRGLRLSGKRIGFAAIALAVTLPAFLPPLEPVSFFTFGVGGSGSGGKGNSIEIPNPIANLKGQLDLPEPRTVLTYTNNDDVPRYLRIYSLDIFTGEEFTMTKPTGTPENRVENGLLPPPPGLGGGVEQVSVVTTIQVSDDVRKMEFLPLPYPPREVRADGDWRADESTLMVFSTRDNATGLRYEVATSDPQPTAQQLRSAPRPQRGPESVESRYLRLPDDFPADIRELAHTTVEGADTDYDRAMKLQEFFTETGDFRYDLRTQGHSTSALRDFLLSSKVGYCEQFASSMAVMARAIGIPARVAIGYTGGKKAGDQWVVGTNDSHSWPELYFEGVGWLPFEPTPAGSAGQGSAQVPLYARPQPTPAATSTSPTPGSTARGEDLPPGQEAGRNPRELDDREARLGNTGLPPEESTPLIVNIGIGLAVLVLLLLVPAGVRLVTRSRRVRALSWKVTAPADELTARVVAGDHPSVAAAWAELDDVLYDYGMAREPSETPRRLAQRLAQQYEFDAGAAAALSSIAATVERALFARDPGEIGPLGKDLRLVRRALAATVTRGRRIRAALLPPSTLRRMRSMGEGLLDGFDRLEGIRLRRPAR